MTTKRPRINLEMIGVPLGAVLSLANTNIHHIFPKEKKRPKPIEDITCVVCQQYPAHVVYEGEVTSLSNSARRASELEFNVQGSCGLPTVPSAFTGNMRGKRFRRAENDSRSTTLEEKVRSAGGTITMYR